MLTHLAKTTTKTVSPTLGRMLAAFHAAGALLQRKAAAVLREGNPAEIKKNGKEELNRPQSLKDPGMSVSEIPRTPSDRSEGCGGLSFIEDLSSNQSKDGAEKIKTPAR